MAVRPMWTGTLSWNMLVMPVKLVKATEDGGLELHQFRKSDGSRIRFRRYAEADGANGPEVNYSEIRMGFELGTGQVVLLEDEDFALAYGAKDKQARVTGFVPVNSLPRIAGAGSYYVQPDKNGEHAYELLAAAMRRQGRAAVVAIAISSRVVNGMLYATGDGYLVLERLHWAADVREPGFRVPETGVTEAEIDMAENLVGMMTGTYSWAEAQDESARRLSEVIMNKAETGQVLGVPSAVAPGTATPPDQVMAALTASIAQAKAERAPAPPVRKPRTRKAAAVKAAA
jgi:DNA end-binding protein Ku